MRIFTVVVYSTTARKSGTYFARDILAANFAFRNYFFEEAVLFCTFNPFWFVPVAPLPPAPGAFSELESLRP